MPKLGIGASLNRTGLTSPAAITTNRPFWGAFDVSGQAGTDNTGQALEFDGVSDHITLSDLITAGISMQTSSGASSSQDNRTVAFWHKSNGSFDTAESVISMAGGGGSNGLGITFAATTGNLTLEVDGGPRNIDVFDCSADDNVWKRYVCIFDAVNSVFRVYVNGAAVTASSSTDLGQ